MVKTGKLIIFNMEKFKSEHKSFPGNTHDVRNLTETFQMYNADVSCVYKNYKLNQIKSVMKKIETEDFSSYKYIVVAVLTHGDRKEVLLSNDDVFELDEIILPVLRNGTLRNKPKLFIIDACKGKFDLITATSNAVIYNEDHGVCPRQTIRFYSTSEGFRAYTTEEHGSIFIKTVCDQLQENGEKENVLNIFEECISIVDDRSGKRQLPSITHNFNASERNEFILGEMKHKS